ncbi:hypothetical protein [Clostridium cellulovorans]|uniref:Uncharacterized protein n=1 Tax=Clostridium cellulovorans (strain ATCC 35296 / DSM 3052 / OCM 3 / 743B) TaxID=573061 RepID=D9SL22_CLOC7|nr:hypothetical protein [Clostridium cellulovorans]ADL53594.1 hypothetical protein Clocel_3928 [Clostridium cellulovorans 743B]
MMMQTITRDHITGALVGAGVLATGYFIYKKNQNRVDEFMRRQGINMPNNMTKDYRSMSFEELLETKELIEDIIAEREEHIHNHGATEPTA